MRRRRPRRGPFVVVVKIRQARPRVAWARAIGRNVQGFKRDHQGVNAMKLLDRNGSRQLVSGA